MDEATRQAGRRVREVRVTKGQANLYGAVLSMVLCVGFLVLAHVHPLHQPPAAWQLPALLISVIASLVVHELLHAVGLMRFGGVAWKDITFGFDWKGLVPFCCFHTPIRMRAYRLMVLLPLWGTGSVTFLGLLLFPADWTAMLAAITIAGCAGDLMLVAGVTGMNDELLVLDSPTEIGCDIFAAGKERE